MKRTSLPILVAMLAILGATQAAEPPATPNSNRKIVVNPVLNPDRVTSHWMCVLEDGSTNRVARLAVDGDVATAIRCTGDDLGVPGSFLQVDLGASHFIQKLRLISKPNLALILPADTKSWGKVSGPTLLKGSNDAKSWTLLATLPEVPADPEATWHDFPVPQTITRPFRYIQIYGGQFMLGEMELYGRPDDSPEGKLREMESSGRADEPALDKDR